MDDIDHGENWFMVGKDQNGLRGFERKPTFEHRKLQKGIPIDWEQQFP